MREGLRCNSSVCRRPIIFREFRGKKKEHFPSLHILTNTSLSVYKINMIHTRFTFDFTRENTIVSVRMLRKPEK